MALHGVKVIELAGLAPVPFCGMLLADFGCTVVRVDSVRATGVAASAEMRDVLSRGKRSVALDLKSAGGRSVLLRLIADADVLLDPFRPGVLEKLGLDPQMLMQHNPRLIIARLTGWGQTGPYSQMAGHDINYLSVSGLLAAFGRADGAPPHAPGNLLADFAGGGLLCALGVLLALFERTRSQRGQVIDVAMIDGLAYLGAFIFQNRSSDLWGGPPGTNLLDGGCPFYQSYRCKDDDDAPGVPRFVAVGALEPHFYEQLVSILQLDLIPDLPHQFDREGWPRLAALLADAFRGKTQSQWTQLFDGTDACVTPVVPTDQLMKHVHAAFRGLLVSEGGSVSPVAAPRLSRTPAYAHKQAGPALGEHSGDVLAECGFSEQEIHLLCESGAVLCAAAPSRSLAAKL